MAPKPTPTGQVEMLQPFVRGRAAAKAFFYDLSSVADIEVGELKKMLDGLQKLAVRDLRSKGSFTLHSFGSFHVKTNPGTAEGPGECHGKQFTRREKPSRKHVICKVASLLSDKVVS
jgi:hypothetical protein